MFPSLPRFQIPCSIFDFQIFSASFEENGYCEQHHRLGQECESMEFKIKSSKFIMIICAVWFCTTLGVTEVSASYVGQTLLAWLEETNDSVSYGTGSEDSASDSSSGEQAFEQSGPASSNDYIQYQAGPTRAQVEDSRRQEQDKEAASLNMLQNLFIDLDARPRMGPFDDGRVR